MLTELDECMIVFLEGLFQLCSLLTVGYFSRSDSTGELHAYDICSSLRSVVTNACTANIGGVRQAHTAVHEWRTYRRFAGIVATYPRTESRKVDRQRKAEGEGRGAEEPTRTNDGRKLRIIEQGQ
jgi:hypothetical protein